MPGWKGDLRCWRGHVFSFRAPLTVYVAYPQGSDTNDGLSPQTPIKTLSEGVRRAEGGDMVFALDSMRS